MTIKYLLILLALFFSISMAHAAGEPMNQDFTKLIKATSEAIDLGKQSKGDAFLASIEATLEIVKDEKLNGDSPKLQRVGAKLKVAKKLGKEGKITEATAAAEEALAVIK